MENIQYDAMAQAILNRLKRGPISESDMNKNFRRHGTGRLAGTLAKLRHTKQITRITEKAK
jgi:hypothetical protein